MPSAWASAILQLISQIHLSHSRPYGSYLNQLGTRQASGHGTSDNGPAARASYAGMSLLCMLLIASLFGSRFYSVFNLKYWKSLSFIRMIPYMLYFNAMAFNVSSSLTILGLDMTKNPECRYAMYVCLVFYVGHKVLVQLFLIERAHAVRQKLKKRLDDWIWILFMLILVCGFGVITILAFLAPVAIVNPGDGQCRIGLPRKSLLVLMTYDVLINVALTFIFLFLLRPLLQMRMPRNIASGISPTTSTTPLRSVSSLSRFNLQRASLGFVGSKQFDLDTTPSSESSIPLQPVSATAIIDPSIANLKVLLGKTIFGAVVMLTATLINLLLLYRYNGEEHGWICFMCCLIDVTWAVLMVHVVTKAKKEDERLALVRYYDSIELRDERQRLVELRRMRSDGSSL